MCELLTVRNSWHMYLWHDLVLQIVHLIPCHVTIFVSSAEEVGIMLIYVMLSVIGLSFLSYIWSHANFFCCKYDLVGNGDKNCYDFFFVNYIYLDIKQGHMYPNIIKWSILVETVLCYAYWNIWRSANVETKQDLTQWVRDKLLPFCRKKL